MEFPVPILQFEITGAMGHFKKYYSNISSLTYEVPPRTVIMGMLASLLGRSRDSYYREFHPEKCKLGVQLCSNTRKLMQCMNYRVKDGSYTQVRLELLLPEEENLKYRIFVAHEDTEEFGALKEVLEAADPGYGLYLGQRPFRADVGEVNIISKSQVGLEEKVTEELQTLTFEDNVIKTNSGGDFQLDITNVSMPVSMKQVENGREPEEYGMMVYERTGNTLPGTYREVIYAGKKPISFFTPVQ